MISVVFSLYYQIPPTTDAKAYNNIARNLSSGKGYVQNAKLAMTPSLDDALVRIGPGYEFFLAALYKVFGYGWKIVWIVQALLRGLSVLLIFYIVRELFWKEEHAVRIGLVAAIIFALIPDLIIMSGMLLAETLFITLLLGGTYFSLRVLRTGLPRDSWCAGILWALASLTRPTAIPLFLLLAGFLFYQKRWKLALPVIGIPLLLLGLWSARNTQVYGKPLFTTTAGSYALWIGNNPDATGGYDKPDRIQDIITRGHSVDVSSVAFHEYISFLSEQPFKFLELQFRKTVLYFSLIRPTGFWFYLEHVPVQQLITLIMSALGAAFLFVMGGAGVLEYIKGMTRKKYFMLTLVALQPLLVIPTYVETRYRYPLYSVLAIFAAYTLWCFWQKKLSWKRVAIVFGFLLFCTAADAAYSRDLLFEKINQIQDSFSASRT